MVALEWMYNEIQNALQSSIFQYLMSCDQVSITTFVLFYIRIFWSRSKDNDVYSYKNL